MKRSAVPVAGIAAMLMASASHAQPDATLPPIGSYRSVHFVGRCGPGQLLHGVDLTVGDDVDAIRPLCAIAYGPSQLGPVQVYAERFGGQERSLLDTQLLGRLSQRRLVCPPESPVVIGMKVGTQGRSAVVNNVHFYCGVAGTAQTKGTHPTVVFNGENSVAARYGEQDCPQGLVAVGINGWAADLVHAVGLICGVPAVTRLRVPRALADALSRRPMSNDFNRDGNADILWSNASTGEAQIWLMSGHSRIGRATVGPSLPIVRPWTIVGSRDFTADGRTDLLVHNSASGEVQIWQIQDFLRTARESVLGENGRISFVGPPWRIAGTFSGSQPAATAIVWHNSATGETQIWSLERHRVTRRATVVGENGSAAFVRSPWSIVGVARMNSDDSSDLLWYNSSTGETRIWYMSDYTVIGTAAVVGENGGIAFVGPPWRITGTNDFNRDGSADILWHNSSTGESQIWFMDGLSVIRRATVDAPRDGGGALVGLPWSITQH